MSTSKGDKNLQNKTGITDEKVKVKKDNTKIVFLVIFIRGKLIVISFTTLIIISR